MLFEFSIAKKYLVPRKRQLSLSLIALMSVAVISLVVWLVLVFLSVTDGIEKNWLKKLTSLNAPIQITPTDAYFESYYYQVDGISSASNYTLKNISEKTSTKLSDPYQPEEDLTIPVYWPEKFTDQNGNLKDLVKLAFTSIDHLNASKEQKLIAQDYEVSYAQLKLQMMRPQGSSIGYSYLTQVSYINSFSNKSPHLHSLIETPRIEDLNHLFTVAEFIEEGKTADERTQQGRLPSQEFQKKVLPILENVSFKRMKLRNQKSSHFLKILPESKLFHVQAYRRQGSLAYFVLSKKKNSPFFENGTLIKTNDKLIFTSENKETTEVGMQIPAYFEEPLSMAAKLNPYSITDLKSLSDLAFTVSGEIQGHAFSGTLPWKDLEIEEAKILTHFEENPKVSPPWVYWVKNRVFLPKVDLAASSILLPKNFQNNQVRIGDRGYFAYDAAGASSVQEQRLPLYVAGFYDPGVMAIGARMILTAPETVHSISSASQTRTFDQSMTNGIQIWFDNLSETADIHQKLTEAFQEAGILPYWKITPFYEYEFAKDLMQQFQSDKYLFTLIAIIVLIVACSNIISLLVILVNDKKREIAILSAMGTPKKSIALIFTLCGGIMGSLSTLIGVAAAYLTIHNIDHVVQLLSFLQGHDAFNTVFYGKSLPNELSERALMFILIATPIISLLAGLIPALKASKVHPSKVLRSEG